MIAAALSNPNSKAAASLQYTGRNPRNTSVACIDSSTRVWNRCSACANAVMNAEGPT
jgi:hypothetical protein